ncbi:type III glutamate--ammonia ligase, partial [Arthrobacter bambusae]
MTSVATPAVLSASALSNAGLPAEAGQISLADIAKAHDVRFLLATFVDMTGKPCAKLVPVEAADELEAGAMGFAGYAAGLIGQKPQDSDLIAIPDLTSF